MAKKRLETTPTISRRQRIVGGVLTGGLVLIAAVILVRQAHYDPGRWQAVAPAVPQINSSDVSNPEATDTQTWDQMPGSRPMGAPQSYDADTLSEKIDGKAELYLSAGFQYLDTRRFELTETPGVWFERYIYAMGTYDNAFSVFSRQRRPDSPPSTVSRDAYQSANGLFLVHGPYYLELIASAASNAVWAPMETMAKAFIDNHPISLKNKEPGALFPRTDLVAESIALTTANAFGFSELDNVYTANYQWAEGQVTAYISERQSPGQAEALARAYADFLITYDARPLEAPPWEGPIFVLDVFGTYEVVFCQGNYMAGVHEADDVRQALALARQLSANLKGDRP